MRPRIRDFATGFQGPVPKYGESQGPLQSVSLDQVTVAAATIAAGGNPSNLVTPKASSFPAKPIAIYNGNYGRNEEVPRLRRNKAAHRVSQEKPGQKRGWFLLQALQEQAYQAASPAKTRAKVRGESQKREAALRANFAPVLGILLVCWLQVPLRQ